MNGHGSVPPKTLLTNTGRRFWPPEPWLVNHCSHGVPRNGWGSIVLSWSHPLKIGIKIIAPIFDIIIVIFKGQFITSKLEKNYSKLKSDILSKWQKSKGLKGVYFCAWIHCVVLTVSVVAQSLTIHVSGVASSEIEGQSCDEMDLSVALNNPLDSASTV